MMHKSQFRDHGATVEPAPLYASDADIELAQQLRHQLEERYFGSSAASPLARDRSSETH
jgi:hypothetical protein